jgi:transcriptional regulator with XRE-family HTH domain
LPTALMARAISRLNSSLIGDLLAEARRNARLTQSEVGRRVGRPQNSVSDVEHGHAYCRFDDFVVIATAIGAGPTTLCGRYLELRALREGIARQSVLRRNG